jgi:hypothetical protein
MKNQIQQKHVNYTPLMAEFLTLKGIEWFGTDADILCLKIESESHNDTEFFELALEYAKWLSDNDGDMTINREAMGGSYHRDPRD